MQRDSKSLSPVDENNKQECIRRTIPYQREETVEKFAHLDSMSYNMNHRRRGIAVIFSHKHFETGHSKRRGTKIDCNNLRKCLACLKFNVEVHKDLTFKGIVNVINKVSKTDHSDHDCLVIAVLSHGKLEKVIAKDSEYPWGVLVNGFTSLNCPTLKGKPKIFFIQACQGHQTDGGITLKQKGHGSQILAYPEVNEKNNEVPHHELSEPDFLLVHSTVPGFVSWRNPESGSIFIQELSLMLKERGSKLDIVSLLTRVSRNVAINFESYHSDNANLNAQKQVPCITSSLTKHLKFS